MFQFFMIANRVRHALVNVGEFVADGNVAGVGTVLVRVLPRIGAIVEDVEEAVRDVREGRYSEVPGDLLEILQNFVDDPEVTAGRVKSAFVASTAVDDFADSVRARAAAVAEPAAVAECEPAIPTTVQTAKVVTLPSVRRGRSGPQSA